MPDLLHKILAWIKLVLIPQLAMADSEQSFNEKQDTTIQAQEAPATPSEAPTPKPHDDTHHHHLPFHHHTHRRHRLHHLIHPNGQHLHVVHHPTEVEQKRIELAKDERYRNSRCEYDVVIYGTPEHLSAIRDVQDHHLSRRDSLRQKNAELFEEFDDLHETLDHLSDELNRLTDHAVALDASFNKFGYHAHIRTKDDVEASSLHSDSSTEVGSSGNSAEQRHKDRSLEPIRFWKTPTIRQYFHKGLLWRSARSGEVGTFELFTDLIYVGVIDYVGEVAVIHASATTFVHFLILFSLAYKIWSDLTVTVNWFEVEDCVGRFAILFVLCCLYGFNTTLEYFFAEEHATFTAAISFYLTQRLFMVGFQILCSALIPMIRGSLLSNAMVGIAASAFYIGASHVNYPYNLVPLFFGLFVDYAGGVFLIMAIRRFKDNEEASTTCQKLAKLFEFVPAVNIEHRVERTSAFTTLVFGYSILKSLYQSHAHVGVNAFLGKGKTPALLCAD